MWKELHQRDESAFQLPGGLETEHNIWRRQDAATHKQSYEMESLQGSPITAFACEMLMEETLWPQPWTEQSTHKRTLWWATGEEWSKDLHSERCVHAVGHLEVDVLDFKYTRRVNNLLIFYFFFGASHLLLTFRILYNDHLLLGETGFHFTLFFFALFINLI